MKRKRINPTWIKWIRPKGELVCSVRPLQATEQNPQATISTVKKDNGYVVCYYRGTYKHSFFLTSKVEANRQALITMNEEHLYPKKPFDPFNDEQ
jgi:hypothetical protein